MEPQKGLSVVGSLHHGNCQVAGDLPVLHGLEGPSIQVPADRVQTVHGLAVQIGQPGAWYRAMLGLGQVTGRSYRGNWHLPNSKI